MIKKYWSKKWMISLLAAIVYFPLSAQEESKLTLIPNAGISLTTIAYGGDNGEVLYDDNSSTLRASLGLAVEMELSDGLFFRPGLNLAFRGGRVEPNINAVRAARGAGVFNFVSDIEGEEDFVQFMERGGDASARVSITYLDVPLNFAYQMSLDNGHLLDFFIGPYVAFAIGGTTTIEADIDFREGEGIRQLEGTDDLDFDDHLKAFDFGLNFGASYQIDQYRFSLGYGIGFADIMQDIDNRNFRDISARNRFFNIGFGYVLEK